MTPLEKNGRTAVLIGREVGIVSAQDLLDLFVTARYEHGSDSLIVYGESLGESFFDLKTGVAGELLQKCSNYRMKLAVVGDFSAVKSKSLRDFIFECNRGRLVFFRPDVGSALEILTRQG